jgi:hypothetical protein
MGCVINGKLMGVDVQKVHSFKKRIVCTGNCFHLDFSHFIHVLGRTDE